VAGSWSRFGSTGDPEGGYADSLEDWTSAWSDNGKEKWSEKQRVMVIGGGEAGFCGLREEMGQLLKRKI
jgi:hypothetical protein